jgi:hypothetical protein
VNEQENIRSKEKATESTKTGLASSHLGHSEDKAKSEKSPTAEAVEKAEAKDKVIGAGLLCLNKKKS